MPLYLLDEDLWFPPVDEALEDGLLAIGGDLSAERLLLAYHNGIFPWFSEDEPPMWWSPNPRFVLFPANLCISKSMAALIRKKEFEFRVDTAFDGVIDNCQQVVRKDQPGTWITDEVASAYKELHRLGYAHSAEAWQGGELVGGLYGVRLGKMFFGESMFSKKSNASKFAFICWIGQLLSEGVELVDCQVYTAHLERLGAGMISRNQFMALIAKLCG